MAQFSAAPFQSSRGLAIAGSFVSPEEDDLYVWIRRFEDASDKGRLYEAVYQSDTWRNEISPKIPDMVAGEKIVARRIEPTSKSVFR
ncbi:MAG: NIPSNAP family containing protein [Chloroflexi bacterium]|nr:NIPSNAP family containing protein [Chloroflexota bacterium]